MVVKAKTMLKTSLGSFQTMSGQQSRGSTEYISSKSPERIA
jgi:hypothetical protein